MADIVSADIIYSGERYVNVHLTNQSDGTGESGVTKIDISTLSIGGKSPSSLTLVESCWSVSGFNYVVVNWVHTSGNSIALVCNNHGRQDFSESGGKHDPDTSAGTGDIVVTTDGAADGDCYDIYMKFKLES